jgi:protein-S-isoprenylcysteine O-methyltransferase Ste14
MVASSVPWWKGSRGEWYLVPQAVLFLLLLVGPRSWPGEPGWGVAAVWAASLAGGVLLLAGAVIAVAGAVTLGRNLTPLPRPRPDTTLVATGAYRFVRHPIYCGISFMAAGWGLMLQSWLTMGYGLLLFAFFDCKSRREERWLMERFPEYAAYRQRVRKLIPFVY